MDLYSFFPFFSLLRSGLQHPVRVYSTNLTEEYIYKPLNMTDIQSALVHPNCMCLKSNRKKFRTPVSLWGKKKGECTLGRMWEKMFERLHLRVCCTRASIFFQLKHHALGKKERDSPSHCLEYREPQDKKWQRHFFVWEEKVRVNFYFFSQVNLFPCIIIPINKLFYSYQYNWHQCLVPQEKKGH